MSNTLGAAQVINGDLVVSWANGSVEVLDSQEREFSEGVPFPTWTFLTWTGSRPGRHVEVVAPSFVAAIDLLESILLEARYSEVTRITHIARRPMREDELGRVRHVRTQGGYAPLAA